MFEWIVKLLGLDPNDRLLKRYRTVVQKINDLESSVSSLSDDEIRASKDLFGARIAAGETLDDLLPEVFARVREVSRRYLGMRHFDVQMIGGMALHERKIAEMKTGEGKTLVATLAVVLNALEGKGVHVVTVNDYLAKRDAEWMEPVYRGMGLSVGVISPFMDSDARSSAYRADITYGTNSEFGFDYLRDNMTHSMQTKVQRGHNYCIVDEVDSILIDEARTPLIISGPSEDSVELYRRADSVARSLRKDIDFEVDEKDRHVSLTEEGIARCEQILNMPDLFTDYVNSELAHKITQSLKAHYLFKKEIQYVIKDGEVVIVDEYTGRLMVGRRYSDGLHQAIEAKERVRIGRENQTLATITLQNYFRMYSKLAGMTGTAQTEAEEFKEIYGLDVCVIPPNLPMKRVDEPDVVYKTKKEKFSAVADEVEESYKKGQPVLVGTTSIENSERMSKLLAARKIPHSVLNAKYHEKEAAIIAQAGRKFAVTVATNMAGRGTDIVLGGNAEFMAREAALKNDIDMASNEFAELEEKIKSQCLEEHNEVIALGGLRIIGVERHESRRIDNQLRGRSGRQGDPGSSRFFIAFEDDLLRLFGGDKIQNIMTKFGMEEGEAIDYPMMSSVIERAQKKIESMHFDVRKQLLAYDNVMNTHREIIYKERDAILQDPDMIGTTRNTIINEVTSICDMIIRNEEELPASVKNAASRARALFGPDVEARLMSIESVEDIDGAASDAASMISDSFLVKVKEIGDEEAAELYRHIRLHLLDSAWMEHLLTMDELRRGIGLRAIGQQDPLLEYQKESDTLFTAMLDSVREKIAEFSMKIRGVRDKVHENSDRGGTDALLPPRPQRRELYFGTPSKQEPTRKKKIGRNDPCPCGSGKKYKFCCGRDDLSAGVHGKL